MSGIPAYREFGWTRTDLALLIGRNADDDWGVPDLLDHWSGPICEDYHASYGLTCTRLPHHIGRHAAGNASGLIVGVWP